MKKFVFILLVFSLLFFQCTATKKGVTKKEITTKVADTIRIANDALEYEVIIIDIGFNTWLASRAKPKNFYSQSYLESKNQFFVVSWNNRVYQPENYDSNLYEMKIDYNAFTDYGLDVNYKLYNYFLFFQEKYKQKL